MTTRSSTTAAKRTLRTAISVSRYLILNVSCSNLSASGPVDDYAGTDLKYFVADSVKACVKACSEYPDNKCKRAIWQTSAGSGGQTGCWLREWNNVDCVPTTKSTAYSSAHVHDSKCPQ